jgi:hypothetical protein
LLLLDLDADSRLFGNAPAKDITPLRTAAPGTADVTG